MVYHLAHWKGEVKQKLLSNEVLDASRVESYCREAGHHWRTSFWSPSITVMTFLLQVLDGAKTLRSAVAVLLSQLADRGATEFPSADPAAYCQARQRLPSEVVQRLLQQTTEHLSRVVSPAQTWLGRQVWIVDGSNASMPDTPELQKRFPQHAQKPGCGFPIAQFVALFCWTTGAIVDVMIDSLIPHELTLFRRLWDHFSPGDVVLGDRGFCNFVDMARLVQRRVDVVFRLHQRRPADFRTGKRLGKDDRRMTWARPKQWTQSMGIAKEELRHLPETLDVRLIRITKVPPGFRSQTLVVVTTLLDPIAFPADDIRVLYRDRWTAELNFRSLKTHMGMEVLRGHRADVVYKEILMHLIAYNLIRLLMWEAARRHGRDLHRLSFTGTLHRLRSVLPRCILPCRMSIMHELLKWIAGDIIPDRPDRIEPRRVKRRPKTYSRLTKPRNYYKRRTHGIDRDAH